MSLSMFYNSDFDSRSVESWTELANESNLMGRAIFVKTVRDSITVDWRACNGVGAADGIFSVEFIEENHDIRGHEHKSVPAAVTSEELIDFSKV